MSIKKIGLGIVGLGTVGSGLIEIIKSTSDSREGRYLWKDITI